MKQYGYELANNAYIGLTETALHDENFLSTLKMPNKINLGDKIFISKHVPKGCLL